MPVTNNHVRPSMSEVSEPKDRKPIFQGYMEHTRGVWLRHNIDLSEMELWHDGLLVTSYEYDAKGNPEIVFTEPLIRAFVTDAVAYGKKLRSHEMKALING